MITQGTTELIANHGWTFHPSRDVLTAGRDMNTVVAIPEYWTHPVHGTVWDVDKVLSYVTEAIARREFPDKRRKQ